MNCLSHRRGYINRVKRLQLLGLFWLLTGSLVHAQVTVEITPAQEQFLPGEPLKVAVRIINLSGQTLNLGADADWLKFGIESREKFVVSELRKPDVQGEFTLESSKAAIKRVDLQPSFDLTRTGHYFVSATVKIKEWGQDFSSRPATFDIIQGAKLWQQEFGLPPKSGQSTQTPEVRKYALQQANYLKQLKLYLQITDATESRIIKVFPIGGMISFSRPEPQLDAQSNLHVLWQVGARAFAYRVITPDGEVIIRRTYDYIGSRPRLATSEDGSVVVQGGVRHETADDLPSRETPPPTTPPAP